jgi:hypothetical protein
VTPDSTITTAMMITTAAAAANGTSQRQVLAPERGLSSRSWRFSLSLSSVMACPPVVHGPVRPARDYCSPGLRWVLLMGATGSNPLSGNSPPAAVKADQIQ